MWSHSKGDLDAADVRITGVCSVVGPHQRTHVLTGEGFSRFSALHIIFRKEVYSLFAVLALSLGWIG